MINLKIGNIRLKLIAYYWDGLKNNIKGNTYFFFFFLLCSCVSKVDNQINHKKVTITEIYKACDDNDSKTIEMWLQSGGDVNVVHPDRGPLIWEACVAGHPNIIKMLIKAGADVNIPNRDGLTPLHEASIRGNTEIIRALIDAGANIHAKDKLNHRPFDYFNIKSQYREKLLKGLIKSN